ncbi:hypothetical protein Fmac_007659 [Flemingia macrophylla]|uniref:Uncharacterized protein n=1 Tax=Flemingia macrophylla TaxID=520843 RepID=A0ABD1MV97_9FABA
MRKVSSMTLTEQKETSSLRWLVMALPPRLKEEGWRPNEVTILGAFSTCSQLGALKQGQIIHTYVVDEKLETIVDEKLDIAGDLDGHKGKVKHVTKIVNKYHDPIIKQRIKEWNKDSRTIEEKFLDIFISLKDAIN